MNQHSSNRLPWAGKSVLAAPAEQNEFGTLKGGIFERWYNDYHSWLDEHGLASGALAWAEKNLKIGDRPYYFDTSHIEWDRKKVVEGHVYYSQKRGRAPMVEVRYREGGNKYVEITPYEMTVRRNHSDKDPYLVYRPFKEADGSTKFRLVREKIDRTYDHDEMPAYANYLLVCARRAMWTALEDSTARWSHTEILHALGNDEPLSKYNDVPVTDKHAALYKAFVQSLSSTNAKAAVDAAYDLYTAVVVEEIRFRTNLKKQQAA